MTLTGDQYQAMRGALRTLLTTPDGNTSDAELTQFLAQLFVEAAAGGLPSVAQRAAGDVAMLALLKSKTFTPASQDVATFFYQARIDSAKIVALAPARYATLKSVFTGALSVYGIKSTAIALAWLSVTPDFSRDPRCLAFFADGNLNDQSTSGVWGPLVATGGAVATGTDPDGNTVWQLRTGSGGYLASTGQTLFNTTSHVFVIAKAGPAPGANQFWLCSNNNGQASFVYVATNGNKLTGSGSVTVFGDTTQHQLWTWDAHNDASQFSANGATYTAVNVGANFAYQGLILGANIGGTNRADVDIGAVIVCEGQASASFLASVAFYCKIRHPSIGTPANLAVSPLVYQQSLGTLPTRPFDVIAIGGQSNNSTFAITGVPTAAGALASVFALDNTIKAMPLLYADQTGDIDTVINNITAGKVGGNGTALAAAYTAASGRPLLMVPGAQNGAAMEAQWAPSLPRGFRLRNCLYGLLLDRTKNAIQLGGIFRFLWWCQGETEAIAGGALLGNYFADTLAFFVAFFGDLGVPMQIVMQRTANTVAGASAANLAALQAAQNALAVALRGKLVLLPSTDGPYEADNLHYQASTQNVIGAAAAAAAVAAGWI